MSREDDDFLVYLHMKEEENLIRHMIEEEENENNGGSSYSYDYEYGGHTPSYDSSSSDDFTFSIKNIGYLAFSLLFLYLILSFINFTGDVLFIIRTSSKALFIPSIIMLIITSIVYINYYNRGKHIRKISFALNLISALMISAAILDRPLDILFFSLIKIIFGTNTFGAFLYMIIILLSKAFKYSVLVVMMLLIQYLTHILINKYFMKNSEFQESLVNRKNTIINRFRRSKSKIC